MTWADAAFITTRLGAGRQVGAEEPYATLAPAPLAGAVPGMLAGLYPAWRASRIEPVEALRA